MQNALKLCAWKSIYGIVLYLYECSTKGKETTKTTKLCINWARLYLLQFRVRLMLCVCVCGSFIHTRKLGESKANRTTFSRFQWSCSFKLCNYDLWKPINFAIPSNRLDINCRKSLIPIVIHTFWRMSNATNTQTYQYHT